MERCGQKDYNKESAFWRNTSFQDFIAPVRLSVCLLFQQTEGSSARMMKHRCLILLHFFNFPHFQENLGFESLHNEKSVLAGKFSPNNRAFYNKLQ